LTNSFIPQDLVVQFVDGGVLKDADQSSITAEEDDHSDSYDNGDGGTFYGNNDDDVIMKNASAISDDRQTSPSWRKGNDFDLSSDSTSKRLRVSTESTVTRTSTEKEGGKEHSDALLQHMAEKKRINQLLEISNGGLENQSAILTEIEAELVQARSDAVGREKKLNEEHNLEINRLQAELDEVKAKLGNNERNLYEFVQNVREALIA
jgi:uncharacterized protein (UPF0216 family)